MVAASEHRRMVGLHVLCLQLVACGLAQMPTDARLAVCNAALTIPDMSPPQRLSPPPGKVVKSSFKMTIAPGSAPPAPGCAAVKFSVASDGSVEDLAVLAEYPPGWGAIVAKAVSGATFSPDAAGGPYGKAIIIGAKRANLPH